MGYPTGAPSMFATPYVDANKGTILPGKGSINWCELREPPSPTARASVVP